MQYFVNGLKIVLKRWPVLAVMYLGLVLPAFGLALQPVWLLRELADRSVIGDIAAGIPDWLVFDVLGFLARAQLADGPIPENLIAGLRALTWTGLLLPLVGGLVSAFLYGGVLRAYITPELPGWGAFLSGCWRWFGCFLFLGFFQTIIFVPGFAFLGVLVLLAFTRVGAWAGVLALAFCGIAFVIWVIFFEVARVQAVVIKTRNPFRAFVRAARLMAYQARKIAGFYALALGALIGVHALFRLGILPHIPLDLLLPALVVQQAFVLLRLFMRAGRLAGLVELAKSSEIV